MIDFITMALSGIIDQLLLGSHLEQFLCQSILIEHLSLLGLCISITAKLAALTLPVLLTRDFGIGLTIFFHTSGSSGTRSDIKVL